MSINCYTKIPNSDYVFPIENNLYLKIILFTNRDFTKLINDETNSKVEFYSITMNINFILSSKNYNISLGLEKMIHHKKNANSKIVYEPKIRSYSYDHNQNCVICKIDY